MQRAKAPGITQEIERRIRLGIYSGHLPSCRVLTREFQVARQTLTNALRPLIRTGLLIPARRNGIAIERSELASGPVVVVSVRHKLSEEEEYIARLMEKITGDGFTAELLDVSTGEDLSDRISPDTQGLLFINSSLNVETARYLDRMGIPFVSCNQLPSYPRLNVVDFDNLTSCQILVETIMAWGYRRFGMFFSGHLEGFNELFRSNILRLKRRLGVPHEEYDDVMLDWSEDTAVMFRRTLQFMSRRKTYPEVLLCFCCITEEMEKILDQPGLKIPDDMLIFALRGDGPLRVGRVRTYAELITQDEIWEQGYALLRETMFTPGMNRICRLVNQKFHFDVEIPRKRSK